jgi:glycine/D-amino acid oxidase-like deaminating enzyme
MAEHLRLEHLRLDTVGDDGPFAFEGEDLGGARGRFLRAGLLGGAGLLLGAAAASGIAEPAAAAPSPRQDRRILRFLLQVEYLQADFYAAASDRGRLRGELREFAEVVGAHEREHVALLEKQLGASTWVKPTFDFGEATINPKRFARAARRLEETGVAAYIGQGANLTSRSVLMVSRITAVEGRHAAWIADFLGLDPAPRVADKAKTGKQVRASIRRTGFLR